MHGMHMGHNSQGSICIILVFVLHASFGSLMICCSLSLQKQLYNRNWEEMTKKYIQQVIWLDVRLNYGFQNEKGRLCSLLSEFDGLNHYIFSFTGHVHRFTYSAWQQFPVSSPFNSKFTKESALYMSLPQVAIHVDILRINVFWYSTG